jgi:uncharacterized protein YdgA (DUF945 family)
MRKTMTTTFVVVVALLVAAVFGVAAWSGGLVTARLEQQGRDLAKLSPNFKLVKQQLSRGLFSSQHEFTVRLGCAPVGLLEGLPDAPAVAPAASEPIELGWRDVVHHGPFPAGRSVGVASIDSELVLPKAYQARIEKLIGKRPLLRVHSAIDFTGELVSEFTVAAFNYADPQQGTLALKPIQGRVMGKVPDSDGAAGTYLLDVPSVELQTRLPDGSSARVVLGRLLSETKIGARTDPALWLTPVESSGMLTSLELSGSAGASGGAALPTLRAFYDGIKFSSVATLDKGLWSNTNRLTAKGKVNDVAIDKLELTSSLKRLHAATYQRLLSTMVDTLFSCSAPAKPEVLAALGPTLQKELLALLVHNPEYALDKLAVELSGKRAELSYGFGTEGVSDSDATLPLPLLLADKGFVRAHVRVHLGLIEQVADRIVNYDSAPGQQTPSAQTSSFVAGMIDQFAQLGYLQREGELVTAAASLQHGQVMLNGKPFALPDLGSLVAP